LAGIKIFVGQISLRRAATLVMTISVLPEARFMWLIGPALAQPGRPRLTVNAGDMTKLSLDQERRTA
jgi:hypothetical protein